MRLLEQGETEDLTQRVGVRVTTETHKEVMGEWMMLVYELCGPSMHLMSTIVHLCKYPNHINSLHDSCLIQPPCTCEELVL